MSRLPVLLLGASVAVFVSSPARAAPAATATTPAALSPAAPQLSGELARAIEPQADGLVVPWSHGFLKLQVVSDDIVRVLHAPDRAFFTRESRMRAPAATAAAPAPTFKVSHDSGTAVLMTAKLTVRAHLVTGRVAFFDAAGHFLAAEREGGTRLDAAEVAGEKTFHVQQRWEPHDGEALYGLGQHQLGLTNVQGHDLELWQHNGTIAVPFVVSSRGYGLLWDNDSFTRFGDTRDAEPLSTAKLLDADGQPGGLTASYFLDPEFRELAVRRTVSSIRITPAPKTPNVGQTPPAPENTAEAWARAHGERQLRTNLAIDPALQSRTAVGLRWEGALEATTAGDHFLHTFSNSGIKVWIDDRLVIDHWRQGWLPWNDVARVRLAAGQRAKLRIEWVRDDQPSHFEVKWKSPAPHADTAFWSEVGDGIDYYFIHGPKPAAVLAGYRTLTGAATLLPKWAFGLWQSRQRYETQQQSIDVVAEYRKRGLPLDVIVQDWLYWPKTGWGSHEFDRERFPEPEKWIRTLHDDLHARLLISVWPKFYLGTANFEAMKARGFLYQPNLDEGVQDWIGGKYTFYDAFNPAARELFWSQLDRELFSKGADAWWLDGSEPELVSSPNVGDTRTHLAPTAAGTGARGLNAYPLENTRAVYEGQRATKPSQRVAILTRSGFAGQQRFAGAVWSGDTSSTWTALARQIPAALGCSASGLPYWTMDIGGFSVPVRFSKDDPAPADVEDWRELNTRWFQFGAFTPMLRVHGEKPWREMWEFGGETHPAFRTMRDFARLHYRLLPYTYAVAGAVTHEGATFLTPLGFEFPQDATAREIGDQYLYGPAFLVSPVTAPLARSRAVYLPAARGGWYDFWSGAALAGGRTIDAPAPYERMPLHVRAGAIVPFGPDLQWTGEKPADPLTVYVYAGADGAFTLYEDDGLTYGYERGECSRIALTWDDATRTLTLGARAGSFPGMLAERTVQIVRVSPQHAAGFSFEPKPDRTVRYTGAELKVTFE